MRALAYSLTYVTELVYCEKLWYIAELGSISVSHLVSLSVHALCREPMRLCMQGSQQEVE